MYATDPPHAGRSDAVAAAWAPVFEAIDFAADENCCPADWLDALGRTPSYRQPSGAYESRPQA